MIDCYRSYKSWRIRMGWEYSGERAERNAWSVFFRRVWPNTLRQRFTFIVGRPFSFAHYVQNLSITDLSRLKRIKQSDIHGTEGDVTTSERSDALSNKTLMINIRIWTINISQQLYTIRRFAPHLVTSPSVPMTTPMSKHSNQMCTNGAE